MFRGKGCMRCHNSGYQGRIGVHELLIPGDAMRELIAGNASTLDLRCPSTQQGVTLIADGWRKDELSMTTLEQDLRKIVVQTV